MSIELCILASGSMGNTTVLRTPRGVMLIDIGIGPRTAAKRLEGTGVRVGDVQAICLTHLDRDHFNASWIRTIVAHGTRVFVAADRRPHLLRWLDHHPLIEEFAALVEPFDGEPFEPIPGLTARAIRLDHDMTGSHGFCFEGFNGRVGYASDLGKVPDVLIQCFEDVDVLAIESNYDPDMQRSSTRPWFLKKRIMGGFGHLSNDQAFDAIRAILARSLKKRNRLPEHIVLLHRSRECNCPDLMRDLFHQDQRIAPRLTLAEQFERSPWLRVKGHKPLTGAQLSLAWG
jgi:phosphoribosyl 1,2-cyclic phosphodiesterase